MARALLIGLAAAVVLVALGLAVLMGRAYRVEWEDLRPRARSLPLADEAGLTGLVDVSFPRRGGAIVRGWYLSPPGGALVILAHGSGADRSQMLPAARVLARHGLGALLYDAPGCGESEGRHTLGHEQVDAARAAVEWASARSEVRRIGGLGFSLGAYALAQAVPDAPPLGPLVLESVPDDLDRMTREGFRHLAAPQVAGAFLAMRRAGWRPEDPTPMGAAPALAQRPVLLMVRAGDRVVPSAATARLRAAIGPAAEWWVVSGAAHVPFAVSDPAEYGTRVTGFLRAAFELGADAPIARH